MRIIILTTLICTLIIPAKASDLFSSGQCITPNTGNQFPPENCGYKSDQKQPMEIINGLPPGTTIEITPLFQGVICRNPLSTTVCLNVPGGLLGGDRLLFGSVMVMEMNGTGDLDGFHRILTIDLESEWHTSTRIPTDPIQSFDTEIVQHLGFLLPGDPDFEQLQFVSGAGLGLPSPGHTDITILPDGNLIVDSFFDISYQIDFVGAPGGALDGLAGSTVGVSHMRSVATERPCVVPQNQPGTVSIPVAGCDFRSANESHIIIDGLPPGTTVELTPQLTDIVCTGPGGVCGQPGGNLGGEYETFDANLIWQVRGTGSLLGFQRILRVPVSAIMSSAPRIPGLPLQVFSHNLDSIQGSLIGDPDFAQLIITSGDINGLPSPGVTVLEDLGDGTFSVDSFFDISYRIDFVGAPGGALEGLSGSTTANVPLLTREKQIAAIQIDDGRKTATLPPDNSVYTAFENHFNIIDGLPPGSSIELTPTLGPYYCTSPVCGLPGGSLGGEFETFDAVLDLQLLGTGSMIGFQRSLSLPVSITNHSAPRTPGDLMQSFDTEMFSLQANLFGDPDFDQLTITGDKSPSPGRTNLTDLLNDTFQIDSFFDISYQIEFIGAPGGYLEGMSGTTTGDITLTASSEPAFSPRRITIIFDSIFPSSDAIQFSGALGNFSLDDDDNSALGNKRTFSNLIPGTFAISATLLPDFTPINVVCIDPDMQTTVDVPGFQSTIQLIEGEEVQCTFTAQPSDTIFANDFEG